MLALKALKNSFKYSGSHYQSLYFTQRATYLQSTVKYNDIVKLYHDEQGFFLNLPGRTLVIDPTSPVSNLAAKAKMTYSDIVEFKIFDEKFTEFGIMTPMQIVMNGDFQLKINNEWYSVLTSTEDPLFEVEPASTYNYHSVYALCQKVGLSQRQSVVLGSFAGQLIEGIHKHLSKEIDKKFVIMITQKTLLNSALRAKSTIADIETKISFLREKLARYEEHQKALDTKLENKARRRLKWFFGWIFTQIVLLQYGTYSAFNWDIMEPITCLLGILDLIIAYSFWLMTNKGYSYGMISRNYQEKHKARFAQKDELDLEEITQIRQMILYLEGKKDLFSSKLEDTLNAIHLDLKIEEVAEKKANAEESDEE
mmetsp:Transcript_23544/g.27274  ORF Transcript_23544/g.27274 Transcript_23544/m.27274 type:complete len:368 (-) Transcript_23544:14-1117(-)